MQNTQRAFAYLDVIFLNRNKGYGAYELRARYPLRLRKAAGAVLFSVGLLALIPFLMAAISTRNETTILTPRFDTTILRRLPIEVVMPPLLPAKSDPKPVAIDKVTPPKIVQDKDANDEDVLQEIDSSRDIGPARVDGIIALAGETGPPGSGTGRGTLVEAGGTKPPTKTVAIIVDIQARFPGDVRSYLASKLNYPDQAREAGIEGRVVVRFIVDEAGNISGATVVRSVGGGCDEEALRVIRGMPLWKPASINGEAVKSYFSLPIKFTLED